MSQDTHGQDGKAGLPLLPLAARRSLRDEVYDRLRDAILERGLEPGTRIVPEEVARSMGVSRTPVVQALDRLARESLLETLPNGRVVVAGISADAARELLEVRLALEAYAGRLVAERGVAPELLARLRATNDAMRQELEHLPGAGGGRRARVVERLIGLNKDFHHLLSAACGNRQLVRLLDEQLDFSLAQPVLLGSSDVDLRDGVAQHAAALDALERGDADAIERILREHLALPLSGILPRILRHTTAQADTTGA